MEYQAFSHPNLGLKKSLKPAQVQRVSWGQRWSASWLASYLGLPLALLALVPSRWGGQRQVTRSVRWPNDSSLLREHWDASNHLILQQSVPTIGCFLTTLPGSSTNDTPCKEASFLLWAPHSLLLGVRGGCLCSGYAFHSLHLTNADGTSLFCLALQVHATLLQPFLSTHLSQATPARVSPFAFSREVPFWAVLGQFGQARPLVGGR